MNLRFYQPYTPSTRYRSVSMFNELSRVQPEKKLTFFYHQAHGRNNRGLITSQHRGSGHKKKYRQLDFHRKEHGIVAKVFSVEYDPFRNARISLLHYLNGKKKLYFVCTRITRER